MTAVELTRLVRDGRGVRETLPCGGVIYFERPLPFLCSFRRPRPRRQREGERLVTPQPAYLIAAPETDIDALVDRIADPLCERFGAFADVRVREAPVTPDPTPIVRLAASADLQAWLDAFDDLEVEGRRARIEAADEPARAAGALVRVTLEVAPIYRDAAGGLFPMSLLALERTFARSLRRGLHGFCVARTSLGVSTPASLGRRCVDAAAVEVDRHLQQTASGYDFLRLATPENGVSSFAEFSSSGYERPPTLRYRRLPIDPEVSKRILFATPIENVEDPTLATLFREKQEELDRQVNMLINRGTPAFRHGSLQVYGEVDGELVRTAHRLLYRLPARAEAVDDGDASIDGRTLARYARAEIDDYRDRFDGFRAEVATDDELASGLLVSGRTLTVSTAWRVSLRRTRALLAHEVGTHLLTFVNGSAQPLRLFRTGLAGYETLQEGLAVIAEYLVGGLTGHRLRVLAGRVLACEALLDGAGFVDTFRLLHGDLGFSARTAYYMTLRVHRGGGLTKDAMYLRGMAAVLEHLARHGSLAPLLVGKVGLHHLDTLDELRDRGLVKPAAVLPTYLQDDSAARRLARLEAGASLVDLADELEHTP